MISQKNGHVKAHELEFEPFIDQEEIQQKVRHLGQTISQDYIGKKPVFISILNGAFVFAADLVRAVTLPCETSFIKLSSYDGLQSTGVVCDIIGLDIDLTNRDVIILEDIVDSGKTMDWFLKDLQKHQPHSIALCSLLVKPEALQYDFPIQYTGFEIPNKFVIGYGLDYNGEGRNFPSIYQLVEESKS